MLDADLTAFQLEFSLPAMLMLTLLPPCAFLLPLLFLLQQKCA